VNYTSDNRGTRFRVDMAKAYPREAGIKRWHRHIQLNRGKSVQVQDDIALTHATSLTQHLMTCYPAKMGKPGELSIHFSPKNGQAGDFIVRYNPK
jgi:hypothetical protein